MPGLRCAVSGCNNNFMGAKEKGCNIKFFVFPRPINFLSQTMRDEWINRCRRVGKFNADRSRICSIHFAPNNFERDLQNELLGLPVRRKLKATAVPTLFLCQDEKKDVGSIREHSHTDSEQKKKSVKNSQDIDLTMPDTYLEQEENAVEDLWVNTCSENSLENLSQEIDLTMPDTYLEQGENAVKDLWVTTFSENSLENSSQDFINIRPNISETSSATTVNYETLYRELSVDFNSFKSKYTKLKITSQKKIKELHDHLRHYKNKNLKTFSKTKKSEMALTLLQKILTKNQINLLSRKKKRVNWTKEEIATAFTLRYYSKKSYIYLKQKLNYPLPALSSLRRWATQINVSEGILTDILLMLKLAGENFSLNERTVVLAFDEVKVKTVEEYSQLNDEILGPYKQMQVIMARGLFSNWKQPIYVAFDQKVTKNILENVIQELHKIAFNVVAVVSDCCGGNVGLWRELEIKIDKTYFEHPVTKKNIYVFADAPHILKLIRNWLFYVGFLLGDGTVLSKDPLVSLVSLTETEVSACWKIKRKHIDCEKGQRQNVRLAAQLLSNTVSTALQRYEPGNNKKMAKDLGKFIGDVNQWFDIFNSYVAQSNVPSKNAYGTDLKTQEEHLDKMYETIENLRPIGKNALQIFQKGMLISINSLKSLYRDMKESLSIKYICTHKLNQDCLENFFFQIRSRGPNEHPSPLTAIHRIRMIILGKNPGVLDAKVNTKEQKEEEYIVVKILDKAEVKSSENINDSNDQTSSFSSSTSSEKSVIETNSQETTHVALEYRL